jgi:hypothetical protein
LPKGCSGEDELYPINNRLQSMSRDDQRFPGNSAGEKGDGIGLRASLHGAVSEKFPDIFFDHLEVSFPPLQQQYHSQRQRSQTTQRKQHPPQYPTFVENHAAGYR